MAGSDEGSEGDGHPLPSPSGGLATSNDRTHEKPGWTVFREIQEFLKSGGIVIRQFRARAMSGYHLGRGTSSNLVLQRQTIAGGST